MKSGQDTFVSCELCPQDPPAAFERKGYMTEGLPEAFWQHIHDAHPLACKAVLRVLPDYARTGLDMALDDQRVMRHLEACAPCRGEFFRLSRVISGGGASEKPSASAA